MPSLAVIGLANKGETEGGHNVPPSLYGSKIPQPE